MRTFLLLCILFSVAFSKLLVYKGGSGCTPSSPCDKCEGDCDSDADCKGTFKCYQRSYSTNPVPGCEVGGSGDKASIDYCYEPCPDGSEISAIGCRGTLASVLASTSETCGITDGSLDIFVNTAIAANEIYDMQSSDFTAKTLTTTAAQINGKLRASSISVTGDIEAGSLTGEIVTGNNIKDNSIDMTKVKGLTSYNRYQSTQAGSNPVYDKVGYLMINNADNWPSAVVFDQDYTDVKRLRADQANIGAVAITNSEGMNIIDGGHDNKGAKVYVGQDINYGGGIKYNPSDDAFHIFRHRASDGDHSLISWPHGDWETAHFRKNIITSYDGIFGNHLSASDGAFYVKDDNYNSDGCTVSINGRVDVHDYQWIRGYRTGPQQGGRYGLWLRGGYWNWGGTYNSHGFSTGDAYKTFYNDKKVGLDVKHGIMGGGYLGLSDERIKRDIKPLPDDIALGIIRKLDTKYYNYKDVVIKGTRRTIGFIAQEVNKTIPEAVTITDGHIPSEMRLIEPEWVKGNKNWTFTVENLLEGGGNYKFYVEDVNGTQSEIFLDTQEDNKTFSTENKYTKIFLYGKHVDDLHAIDKDKIFAVAYAALQQVDKNQQILQQKVATLEDTIAKLTARLDALEAK